MLCRKTRLRSAHDVVKSGVDRGAVREATGLHYTRQWNGGGMAARGARAAG